MTLFNLSLWLRLLEWGYTTIFVAFFIEIFLISDGKDIGEEIYVIVIAGFIAFVLFCLVLFWIIVPKDKLNLRDKHSYFWPWFDETRPNLYAPANVISLVEAIIIAVSAVFIAPQGSIIALGVILAVEVLVVTFLVALRAFKYRNKAIEETLVRVAFILMIIV
jgi:hypothetical protein